MSDRADEAANSAAEQYFRGEGPRSLAAIIAAAIRSYAAEIGAERDQAIGELSANRQRTIEATRHIEACTAALVAERDILTRQLEIAQDAHDVLVKALNDVTAERDQFSTHAVTLTADCYTANGKIEELEAECDRLREALKQILIYRVEEDDRVWLKICGVVINATLDNGESDDEIAALLKFDAMQRTLSSPTPEGGKP